MHLYVVIQSQIGMYVKFVDLKSYLS